LFCLPLLLVWQTVTRLLLLLDGGFPRRCVWVPRLDVHNLSGSSMQNLQNGDRAFSVAKQCWALR
jgi:hypothetical protein